MSWLQILRHDVMGIRKIIKRRVMGRRWMLVIYLDKKIDRNKLAENNKDIEYNPDAGIKYPTIRTSAGTICYMAQSIRITNPRTGDILPIIQFAVNKLDGRKVSRSWFEFINYWKNEINDLNKLEKKLDELFE